MTWSRREAVATAPPLELWMKCDDSNLSERAGEDLRNREVAMRLFMAGQSYKQITRVTGLHRNHITNLARKCLSLGPDGNIYGFRGILPFLRTTAYQRSAPIVSKRQEQQGGMSGALSTVLARFPDLEKELVRLIQKRKNDRVVPETRLRASTLHQIFTTALRNRGVSRQEWPFNTKMEGRRTIQEYMRSINQSDLQRSVTTRESQTAIAHMATGKGPTSLIPFAEPYDAVEIDAYHVDAFLTASFRTPEGTDADVALSRLWILAVVERMSTATLAYRMIYRSEVTAADVAAVIRDAICTRWEPKILTVKSLQYPKDGGFPSGVIPEAYGAVWSVTMLDGALANLANLIHDTVRRSTGFVINWGPPGHFERRPNVERAFKKIADGLFHRLPSTTGSNPKSGRVPNAAAVAELHRIRASEVEELVDVVFAEQNGLPGSRNSYNSPLQTLEYFLCGPEPKMMTRKLPAATSSEVSLLSRRENRTVRGGPKSGRRPYIQFENVHYSSSVLGDAAGLVGSDLTLHVDDSDLRQVTAFLPNGAELGILKAGGKWSVTKHDIKTRKIIGRLISKRIMVLSETDDPVQCYLRHVSDHPRHARKGASLPSKHATEVVRVSRDANVVPFMGKTDPAKSLQTSSAKEKDGRALTSSTPARKGRPFMPPPSDGLFKAKNR